MWLFAGWSPMCLSPQAHGSESALTLPQHPGVSWHPWPCHSLGMQCLIHLNGLLPQKTQQQLG